MPLLLYQSGEFGLIRKIRKIVGPPRNNLQVGLGDDAAVFLNSSEKTIVTTDMLIEGIHFDFKFGTPFEIGWQAMAANLSDIAAMGGWPLYALVGIGARSSISVAKVMAIYKGMMKLAGRFNCQIVGGDTVSTSGPFTISLTIIGFPIGKKIFLRSFAKPGDKILVTGWLGKAALALRKGRMLRTIPRLEEIKFLSQRLRINALIDLSDGLSSDLTRIAEESKIGALIFEENLPLAPLGPRSSRKERVKMALNGGEDFELLLTTPEKKIGPIASQFRKKFNLPLSCIGEIRPGNYGLKTRYQDGTEKKLEARGYEHFKS